MTLSIKDKYGRIYLPSKYHFNLFLHTNHQNMTMPLISRNPQKIPKCTTSLNFSGIRLNNVHWVHKMYQDTEIKKTQSLTSHWGQADAEKGVQYDNDCLIAGSSKENSPDL